MVISTGSQPETVSQPSAELTVCNVSSWDPEMSLGVNSKVVVVGCGISGTAAAHRLVKAGFHHVRILEATARSGGRIRTGRLGERLSVFCGNFCTLAPQCVYRRDRLTGSDRSDTRLIVLRVYYSRSGCSLLSSQFTTVDIGVHCW